MQPPSPPPLQMSSLPLPQQHIITLAQQFTTTNNPESQKQLKQSNWQDILQIITNQSIDQNVRIVCCSLLKWLVYHKKFVTDHMALYRALCRYYVGDVHGQGEGNVGDDWGKFTKGQQIVQIVIKVIPSTYMTQNQKEGIVQQLLKNLESNIQKSPKILKLLCLLIQQLQIDHLNNQVLVGQLLLFLQSVLQSPSLPLYLKLSSLSGTLSLIQQLLDLVNNDDDITQNCIQQFLNGSTLAKKILKTIICEGAEGKQIIGDNEQVNLVKVKAIQLYSCVWVYGVEDQELFRLCLNSVINKPDRLIDSASDIMEKILTMLQRSISHQQFYPLFHSNLQSLCLSLLSLLSPSPLQSTLVQEDPEHFVQLLTDRCMQQQLQNIQTKSASIISSLCLYIDGYMSFMGGLGIMMLKKFNGSIGGVEGGKEYVDIIQGLWVGGRGEKAAQGNADAEKEREMERIGVCVEVLAALSDQIGKRDDLVRPLRYELFNMNHMFKHPQCKLKPSLICRFMLLYSFYAYPKCLDVFLPYKQIKSVYQSQLQACYSILRRYYLRFEQCKRYIDQLSHILLMSNYLTPLMQTSIMNAQLTPKVQYMFLQKLVLWLHDSMEESNRIASSKLSNLITILLDRMTIEDANKDEQAVWGYLEPVFRKSTSKDGQENQQFFVEICVSFIKKFSSLEKKREKLMYILELGYQIVERNNGILNSCLDLFFQITKYLPADLITTLAQIYIRCLSSSTREEDHWQCYHGLENCMLRLYMLKSTPPNINISEVNSKFPTYKSSILISKCHLFLLSMTLVSPQIYQSLVSLPPPSPPPYETKPLLCYLLLSTPPLPPAQSIPILTHILSLLKLYQKIGYLCQEYQQQIYTNMQSHPQITINAYGVFKRLGHPIGIDKIDVYQEWRNYWGRIDRKREILEQIGEDMKTYITELCTQKVVNRKVRKIFKVKRDFGEVQEMGEGEREHGEMKEESNQQTNIMKQKDYNENEMN